MPCLSGLEPYDGWLVERIVALLKKHDRRVRRRVIEENNRRTSEAMRRHQANGRRMSSKPPYGWRIDPADPARLVKDPAEQEIISRIVQERAAGRSLQAIARRLTEDGIPSRGGRTWHHDTVRRIIRRTQETPAPSP